MEQKERTWVKPENPSPASVCGGGGANLKDKKSASKKSFTSLVKPNGFTLAETMLVTIILGIIAVLVVPQLIRRQVEISNRTKLKKAMAAYDYLMNRMILENDLHSNTALKTWGTNCSNSANYFKISQETNNPCVFKTTDGVWWDIENIQQPKVAFDQGDLDLADSDSPKAFYLIAHYDDQGIIRISDNAYEKSGYTKGTDDEVTDGDKAMDKLYSFVKNKKSSGEEEETGSLTAFEKCAKEGTSPCVVGGANYTLTPTLTPIENYEYGSSCDGPCYASYDGTPMWITTDNTISEEEAKATITDGTSICTDYVCTSNGDYHQAAKNKCESQGAHLATVGELKSLKDSGQLPSGSWFWAAEEHNPSDAYAMESNGYVYKPSKSNNGKVVCVGN